MNSQIQLTETELAEIMAKRNAQKSEAQVRLDYQIKKATDFVEKEAKRQEAKYLQIKRTFDALVELNSGLDLKLVENFKSVVPYDYMIAEIGDLDVSKTVQLATIMLTYVNDKAEMREERLEIEDGKIYVPSYFNNTGRYNQKLIVPSFIKRVKEVLVQKQEALERAVTLEKGIIELRNKLASESPKGTSSLEVQNTNVHTIIVELDMILTS